MPSMFIRALMVALSLLWIATSHAATRTALVIGNSNYAFGPLANPVNDAKLMAETLKRTGFDVTVVLDADRQTMQKALLAYSRDIRDKDTVGLFYFAGHGAQTGGANYLIPVDADIKAEQELKIFGINVDEFVATLERSDGRVNIVVLDSCRNNPFGSTARSAKRGFTAIDAPAGTFVAFSTAPGQVALDGEGSNSPYAKALAEAIAAPGVSIEQAFKITRRNVLATTGQSQTPWESSSLTGDFFFTEAPAPIEPPKVVAAPKVVEEPKFEPVEEQVAVVVPEPEQGPVVVEEPAAVPTEVVAAPVAVEELTLTPRIIPVGKWPEGIVMADGALWVAESGARQISRFDINSGKKLATVPVGRLPVHIIADGEANVFAAVVTDRKIFKSGANGSKKSISTFKAGDLNGLSLAAGRLYATVTTFDSDFLTQITRMDPATGKIDGASYLPSKGNVRALITANEQPWVLSDGNQLAAIDTTSLQPVFDVTLDNFIWRIAANRDAVFAGGQEQQSVGMAIIHRFALSNPVERITQKLDGEELIMAIAATETRVAAIGSQGRVWILDAATLLPLKRFNIGIDPRSALFHDGKLYIAVHKGVGINGSILVYDDLAD